MLREDLKRMLKKLEVVFEVNGVDYKVPLPDEQIDSILSKNEALLERAHEILKEQEDAP